MKAARRMCQACGVTLLVAAVGLAAGAQGTNTPPAANAPAPGLAEVTQADERRPTSAETAAVARRNDSSSSRLDESAFRIITERNIFNANRSGGQVRLTTRRPSRVESFKLVGTMAYEKGTFAFFEGSNSELTKDVKSGGIIAGHKLLDIQNNGVKLEADGKVIELAVGFAMRREDEGTWQPGEAVAGSSGGSSRREDEDSSHSRGRDDRSTRYDSRDRSDASSASGPAASPTSSADQAEILKRLMERRERESQ